MAKITFKNQSDYFLRLQELEQHFAKESTLEKAVHAGAAIVADEVRKNIESLPEEQFRHLDTFWGDYFREVPTGQKKDLVDSFGLTPIERDKNGFVHTKAGFEGYGSYPTNTYPQGVPNALVARAIESGSSVRDKTPFVRPAVNATREKAIEAMEQVVDDECKKSSTNALQARVAKHPIASKQEGGESMEKRNPPSEQRTDFQAKYERDSRIIAGISIATSLLGVLMTVLRLLMQ